MNALPCVLCGNPAREDTAADPAFLIVCCSRCGTFHYFYAVKSQIASLSDPERGELSILARTLTPLHYSQHARFVLEDPRAPNPAPPYRTIKQVLDNARAVSIGDRLDRALLKLTERCRFGGERLELSSGTDTPDLHARTVEEFKWMIRTLREQGLLATNPSESFMPVEVTSAGWARVEVLRRTHGNTVFVAMWFPPERHAFHEVLTRAYGDAIEPAIVHCKCEPVRIDRKLHVGKICEEVLLDIRRARAVIADFTGQRPNVYFEAGFARSRNIPVVWTCHADDFDGDDDGKHVHFDVRQHNFLVWSSPEELGERLPKLLEAVLNP